jgi:hypothetical protein
MELYVVANPTVYGRIPLSLRVEHLGIDPSIFGIFLLDVRKELALLLICHEMALLFLFLFLNGSIVHALVETKIIEEPAFFRKIP